MNAQLKPQLAANGLDVRRTGRITGSRIGPILGLSPYSDRSAVLREMVREHFDAPTEFVGNVATDHGTAHELDALAWYEETRSVMTSNNQEFIIHPEYDFLAVTIDGRVEDGLVETKAPYRAKYTEMPAYYMPQVQLQLACAGASWCDFVCWRSDGNSFIERVYADSDFIEKNLPKLEAFMAEYEATIRDKAKSAPYLQDKGRDDADWKAAAADYLAASQAADVAKMELEAAKQRLLDLAGNQSAKGAGVQVIRSERKGAVKYAEAIKELLPDTDLTPWTGEPVTVFTVKVAS